MNNRTLTDIKNDIESTKIKINIEKENLKNFKKEYLEMRDNLIETEFLKKNEFGRKLYQNQEIAKKLGVSHAVVCKVVRERGLHNREEQDSK